MKADPTRPSAKAPPGYVSRSRAEQRTCHYTVVPRHTYLWLPGWSHGNYYGSDHRQVAWRADRGARVRDLAAFIAGGELAALRLRVLTEAARLIRPSRLDGYATIHRGRATVTAEQADAHVYRIRAELLRHPVTQRFPEAVAVVGEAALEAALRRLPAATCRWCWAKLDAEVNDWDPPKYDTLTRALLGPACDDCRRALAPTRSVHKDQLRREQTRARGQTAAVLPPAGNLPHLDGCELCARTRTVVASLPKITRIGEAIMWAARKPHHPMTRAQLLAAFEGRP